MIRGRVGDQIEAGDTYTLYVNVLIDVMPDLRSASDIAASIRIGAIFDNRQILTIEKDIRFIKDILEDCQ